MPPWLNETYLNEIAQRFPLVKGLTIPEFNRKYCKSMTLGNETRGIMIHPAGYQFQFGDGVVPYAGDERCVWGILPQPVPGFDSPLGKVIMGRMFFANLNLGDSILVFSSVVGASGLSPCGYFSAFRQCQAAACSWDAKAQVCFSDASQAATGCPLDMPGYTLKRVITYGVYLDAGEAFSFAGHVDDGMILVACSGKLNVDGLGSLMQYKVQGTFCPNDCMDTTGTQNGLCTAPEADVWRCQCNNGFTGADCSRPATCRGTGPAATVMRGAGGEPEVMSMQDNSCGAQIFAEPKATSSVSMERYGIGFAITSVQMRSGNVTECAVYFIAIRKGDALGDLIKKLCPDDLYVVSNRSADAFRGVVTDAVSIYLEYRGDPGDTFTVVYSPVSLVCPGRVGASGVPSTADEICDGKGSCVRLNYESSTGALPVTLYRCECRSPWASTFSTDSGGVSCDTCAFGYKKSTYPVCEPATVCAANCSSAGVCVEGVGCKCFPGRYGLDCQLIDDGDRLGSLSGELIHRLPLNAFDAGNAVESGSYDRTLTMCSLPGSQRPCRADARVRGRKSPQQESTSAKQVLSGSIFSRRQSNASADGNGTLALNASATQDLGLSLNTLSSMDTYPDFIRTDNISGTSLDVYGAMTLAGWVRFSSRSDGFFFAKVDSGFLTDGRSPALERARFDVLDRFLPETALMSANAGDSLSTHMAVYVEGSKKRISLLVSDPDARATAQTKEDWFYVRHFRLGAAAGDLFDDSWRFVALRIYQRNYRKEAQIFIDGVSQAVDPNWVQCLPWVPKRIRHWHHWIGNLSLSFLAPGASIMWGYRLKASLDELHVYRTALSPTVIPRVGGISGRSPIEIWLLSILIALDSIAILLGMGVALYHIVRLIRERRKAAKAKATDESEIEKPVTEKEETPKKTPKGLEYSPRTDDGAPTLIDPIHPFGIATQEERTRPVEAGDHSAENTAPSDEESLNQSTLAGSGRRNELRLSTIQLATSLSSRKPVEDEATDKIQPLSLSVGSAMDESTERTTGGALVHLGKKGAASDQSPPEQRLECISLDDAPAGDQGNSKQKQSLSIPTEPGAPSENGGAVPPQAQPIDLDRSSPLPKPRRPSLPPLKSSIFIHDATSSSSIVDRLNLDMDSPHHEVDTEGGDHINSNSDQQLPVGPRRYDLVMNVPNTIGKGHELETYFTDVMRKNRVALLQDIVELKRSELEKKQRGGPKAVDSAGNSSSLSDVAEGVTIVAASWQMLSQLASGMELPDEWMGIWGEFFHFWTLDWTAAFGAIFAGVFFFVLSVAFLASLLLFIMHCLTKQLSRHDVEVSLLNQLQARWNAKQQKTDYKPQADKRGKVTVAAATLLGIFFVPSVNLSISVLACSPNVMCIYDCYNEALHRVLVVVAGFALAIFVVSVPSLYFSIIYRTRRQFQEYLATQDSEILEEHWGSYMDVVESPFSGLYANLEYASGYFQPLSLLYRAALTFSIAWTPSESPFQLAITTVLQVLYAMVVFAKTPFRRPTVNIILGVSQFYTTLILLLRAAQLVSEDDSGVGIAMTVFSCIAVALCLVLLLFLVGRSAREKVAEWKAGKRSAEEKHETIGEESVAVPPVRKELA